MHLPHVLLTSLFTCVTLAAQGEIVRYPFEARDAGQVINYARGASAGPRLGTLSYPLNWAYNDGRFGSGLKHSMYGGLSGNYVRTGWNSGHSGALTIAFFLRNALANSVSAYSPVAGQQSWSLATGGSAGAGLQLSGWGGPALNGDFGLALCSMPGWNHFAIVVDPTAGTATWYRNGVVASSTPISQGTSLAAGSELIVGADYVNWCGSLYDLDEFVMAGRAATAAEIQVWATQPVAAAVGFGVARPEATVVPSGDPVLGSNTFAFQLTGPALGAHVVILGRSYSEFGTLSLPLELPIAPGHSLLVAPVMIAAGAFDGSGSARLPLPVPANPTLAGAAFYAQLLTLSTAGTLSAGNAVAAYLGQGF